jgi:hypothetical protein
MRLSLILLCLVVLLMGTAASAYEIAVATNGPVKSLLEARDAARAYRAAHPDEKVTITLRAGYYFLDSPVTFGPEDGGLTVQGKAGEVATLGSGRKITGWRKLDANLWCADVPEAKDRTWDFRTLTVNGGWRHRSFLPQTGFYEHLSVYSEPWRSTTGGGFGVVSPELKKTMIYKPEDLGGWLSTANAELIIYHSWDMSHARIESNDTKSNVLTLTPLLGYPAGAFGIKKYKVENTKEGMHTPGLWYLDRDKGQVVYWPLPGEDLTKAEVVAPVGNALIKIEGAAGKPVGNFTLRNLTLADTNVPWKSPGFGASGISDNAISLVRGENCLLSDLHLKAIGGNGIVIYLGDSNRVSRCHLEYIGASGLKGNGTKVPGEGDNLVIEDNHLEHIGMVYPGGLGMTIGNVAGARVLRNLIHDCGYSGICFSADKTDTPTNGLIENNHIYRVMTALNDGAAIYLGNRLDGTFVRGNVCHDIHGLSGQGWGIYPDEQSRFLTITGNLVYRCLGSFHLHMAHDITLDNNIGVFGDEYLVSLAKTTNVTLTRNIFVTREQPIFLKWQDPLKDSLTKSDNNVFFSTTAQKPLLGKNNWEEWTAAGFDTNSAFADPLFANAAKDDYTLLDASPAYKLGFQKLDLSRVPKGQ